MTFNFGDNEAGYIHIRSNGVEWVYYIDLSTDEHIVHRWTEAKEATPQERSGYRCVWLKED